MGDLEITLKPPCDVCPWRKYPDRAQGCDNAGCGYMHLYVAEEYYQRAMGYWPYAGEEALSARILLKDAAKLLDYLTNEENDL